MTTRKPAVTVTNGILVDTCVWSLALRRDGNLQAPAVRYLHQTLVGGQTVVTTGIILAELLRGAVHKDSRAKILQNLAALTYLEPSREDYILSAELSNTCRKHGVQLATVDSILAALTINNGLALLTTGRDFEYATRHIPLRLTAI
ncbi:type II toxin-antitoxin system VapC family toxin [Mobiluncus mulieris]|uniref:type II toxin-antitoxin system VapC family toxin n=1 Tax=Mobiluncus mulieris TaxID=2052 RepID=UPI001B8C9CEA|nr:PIN domain-containing protein [Mobiluncus mulieris]